MSPNNDEISITKEQLDEIKKETESPYESIRNKAKKKLKDVKTKLVEYTSINILEEKLGVIGWEKIEDYILTGGLTGDPILLVGEPGTNKTGVIQDFAELLSLNFQTYPADKAQFEEIVGFPDLKSTGEMDYLKTPMSIWGKECILIDEINRTLPQHQNKWLEVIRDRSIQGQKIPTLKWVFAAMNPPENVGTNPLDAALASRFSLVVKVPDIFEMKDAQIKRLLDIESKKDTPAVGYWNPNFERKIVHLENKEAKSFDLTEFMKGAAIRYNDSLRGIDKEKIKEYVSKFVKVLRNDNRGSVKIEGRRANMMIKSILGMIAVREQKVQRKLNFEELKNTLQDIVQANSLGLVIGEVEDFRAYMNAHKASLIAIIDIEDIKFAKELFQGSLKEKFKTFYNLGIIAKEKEGGVDEKTIAACESFLTNVVEDLGGNDATSSFTEKQLEFSTIIAFFKAFSDENLLISKEIKKKMTELFKIASITNKTMESIEYIKAQKNLKYIVNFLEAKYKIDKTYGLALAERVLTYYLEDMDRALLEKGHYDKKDVLRELESEYFEQREILEELYLFITGKEDVSSEIKRLTEEEITELTIEEKKSKKKIDEDDDDNDDDEDSENDENDEINDDDIESEE